MELELVAKVHRRERRVHLATNVVRAQDLFFSCKRPNLRHDAHARKAHSSCFSAISGHVAFVVKHYGMDLVLTSEINVDGTVILKSRLNNSGRGMILIAKRIKVNLEVP